MTRTARHTRGPRPDTPSASFFQPDNFFVAEFQSSFAVLEHGFELLVLSREIDVVRNLARFLSAGLLT
jgi:hypothetical protein